MQLDDRYVSYAVTAAEKFQLKAFLWKFPLVGEVPYKGFFVRADADEEAAELKRQGYDTLVRGVSAYSTLGWIRDPILSSMLNYRDEDFVNLLIHESIHANIYIKSEADFNEQLATFLGNKGSEAFYAAHPDLKSSAIQYTKDASADEEVFSAFMTKELKDLEGFYEQNKSLTEEIKTKRLKEIQDRFRQNIQKKLKTASYSRFAEEELNNAVLISYKTYVLNMDDFEKAFQKSGGNFKNFLAFCKQLEKSADPQSALKSY